MRTYAGPICGALHNSHADTHVHGFPFMPPPAHPPTHTHVCPASNQTPTDADELQPTLLGDGPLPLTVLVHLAAARLTTSSISLSINPFVFFFFFFFCRHRCPRSYTVGVGADGSYSSPSIRALWGEQGDDNPQGCMCVCLYLCIYIYINVFVRSFLHCLPECVHGAR